MAHALLRPAFLHPSARHAAARAARTLPLRTALIAACALSIGAAAWFGDPSGYLQADPALARLLRGMALIKSTIVLGAVGAVFWRFGFATSRPAAAVYVVGCGALAGSTMLIWQLTLIPLAAVLFHLSAVCMLLVGWRER